MSATKRATGVRGWLGGSTTRQFGVFVAVVLVSTAAIFGAAGLGAFEDEPDTEPALPFPVTSGIDGQTPDTADLLELDIPDVAGRTGGTMRVSVPGWPTCLNPILTACAAQDELHWTIAEHVLPKLMELDAQGEYVASPLLVERPTVANGGITNDPFMVTYRLDPDARWSDGTPISSSDVEFTWDAILATDGSADRDRYRGIVVDASVPDEVVISFDEPRLDWPELFGGERGYVLQASGFLNPDVGEELADFVPFSGGPWVLESWNDTEAVLVANSTYWNVDRIPRLDRAVFVSDAGDTTTPAQLVAGDVAASYRPETGPIRRPSRADLEILVGRSSTYSALWFNQRGPLADRVVRSALERLVPRASILRDIVQPEFPELPLLQCVGWVPTLGSWCFEGDYATFLFDLEGAARLLNDAGYVVPLGSDDALRVDQEGNPISLTLVVDESEPFASEIASEVKNHAAFVQLDVSIEELSSDLLERRLRARDYDLALVTDEAHANPSLTHLFACDAAPSGANAPERGNFVGWCNVGVDRALENLDLEPTSARQVPLVRTIGDFVVSDHVAIPLFQVPTLTVWQSDLIAGPIGEFASSPYSSYWNMFEWEAVAPQPDGAGDTNG